MLSARANACVDKLMALLSMEIDHITSESIITITSIQCYIVVYLIMYQFVDILRKYENTHETILPRLPSCYDVMTRHQGKAALIWIIGEYGEVS